MPWLRFAKTLSALSRAHHQIYISNSRRADKPKQPKLRRPCSGKARGAPGISIPSLTRGRTLPHQCEGSGAPKGAGNIDTPCGARPCEGRSPRGAPLRRFSFDPETPSEVGQGRSTDETPLIPRAFTRVHPPPPARCRTDPRSWAGQCLPRPPGVSVRDPPAGAEPVPPFRRL